MAVDLKCWSCTAAWGNGVSHVPKALKYFLDWQLISSYSRLFGFEAARILFRLGCDVRVFNPAGLPVEDDLQHFHSKVQETRGLSRWNDEHVWISPKQHGNLVCRVLRIIRPVLTRHSRTDDSIQNPDWLSIFIHRLCSSDARPHTSGCSGQQWFSVL